MYFADLTPYSYHGPPEPESLNIGWLDASHAYCHGSVPAGFLERLAEFCKRPPKQHRGFHVCEICNFGPQPDLSVQAALDEQFERWKSAGALSSTEIRVRGREAKVYASPALIYHYIAAHGYQPPDEFIEAVMEADDRART